MADGRGVGQSYIPDCQLNYNLQEKYSVMDTNDYRYFLQHNFEKVKKDLGVTGNADLCKKCPVCQAALVWLPKNGHTSESDVRIQNVSPSSSLNTINESWLKYPNYWN